MQVGWSHLALAGAWGTLVSLERRAFLQAMFSRPLVAATGMGLLLGQLQTGLYLGMILELFYLGTASLGAALPENDTLAASGTTAAAAMMAAQTGGGGTPAIWSLSLILFSGLGLLGRAVDRRVEAYSATLSVHGLELAEHGELERAVRQNLWGIWPYALVYFVLNLACAGLGLWIGTLLPRVPLVVLRGLAWAFPAMASVAAAIAARGSHARNAALWGLVGAATMTAATLVLAWVTG
ncbi:MAG TPA: PTS sugar transporter subunit IIC [Myxococcaceae bacterium]|nr:PTS sugar transporter subunit IIC [Myxococcaceae bacterium]